MPPCQHRWAVSSAHLPPRPGVFGLWSHLAGCAAVPASACWRLFMFGLTSLTLSTCTHVDEVSDVSCQDVVAPSLGRRSEHANHFHAERTCFLTAAQHHHHHLGTITEARQSQASTRLWLSDHEGIWGDGVLHPVLAVPLINTDRVRSSGQRFH